MRNKASKSQKSKKKGSDNAFGCDLIEHLQSSGQDVPQVLKKCAEFIEKHGIVDGIYRLSGITSNIQRLRQEFCSEACPELTKEMYLQDIHCVGSLCKLYFRELPNPLLTYELYSKFTDAVSVQGDHEQLVHIQKVVKELPTPHFRTLEYLTKHLARLATLSTKTNMHTRNLALVWAPNLLRSKDFEVSSGNGDIAFKEVRVQQSVIEFILNNTEQIFSSGPVQIKPKEGPGLLCGEKYATLPISASSGPMKLMSLEEAQARSLSPNHPVHKERQRENSLPDPSTAQLYHTVIDLDSKRKFSGKSKKWKSIFNLGRSVDSKGKLSRNGSVFIRAQAITEKKALRPSRSMESLCSLPTDDDRSGGGAGAGPASIFAPDVKSRTLGSDSLFDLSEDEPTWEIKGIKPSGATAGWTSHRNHTSPLGTSLPSQKTLPEQLKVFKGEDIRGFQPTSPKSRRMLYSSHSSSSRPSFPGSFFPLESSPRHQRRALNISEPFAVSVPLRVSAVISSNSTPCRNLVKDKAAALKIPEVSSIGRSNSVSQLETKKQEEQGSPVTLDDPTQNCDQGSQPSTNGSESKESLTESAKEPRAPSCGEDLHNPSKPKKLEKVCSFGKDSWTLHQKLKISEPEIKLLDETFKPVFGTQTSCEGIKKLTQDVKSKRSQSSPSLTLLCKETSSTTSLNTHKTGSESTKKQTSESDILFSVRKDIDLVGGGSSESIQVTKSADGVKKMSQIKTSNNEITQRPAPLDQDDSLTQKTVETKEVIQHKDNTISHDTLKKNLVLQLDSVPRLSVCLEERRSILECDDEDGCGHELELVEPWEDLNSTKQWVTSPLHSPDVEKLFNQLVPSCSEEDFAASKELNVSPPLSDINKPSTQPGPTNNNPQSKPEAKWMHVPTRNNTSQPHKSSTNKHKNTASSQRFHRQMSYETAAVDRKHEENSFSRHRPYSLNLDLGHRCIRDISNQQNLGSSEFSSSGQKGSQAGSINNCLSELDLFLNDNQAPLRRNSAPPVSVSSIRTAFMIKTCQAKAVPVIPPKVQYSQIPHSRLEKDAVNEEKECVKNSSEKVNVIPSQPIMSELKEELENKEPKCEKPKSQKGTEKSLESAPPELPVITRRHAPSLEVFVDAPRPNRSNLLQRSSFRNRQRPQSLILLSPPFPIMDYPTSGDDGKLLSSIKSLTDASSESLRASEGVQNKMTIPKSGQRLETSTSCFYQPQRRSMIFDSRSHRQIE